jgi:hypothetical protein
VRWILSLGRADSRQATGGYRALDTDRRLRWVERVTGNRLELTVLPEAECLRADRLAEFLGISITT